MKKILTGLISHFDWLYVPKITFADILEIIILAYLIYHIILWFKNTRAWTLLKGILVLAVVMSLAYVFQLNTLMWIFKNTINVGIIAVIILFQPEIRRALEELGRKKLLSDVIPKDDKNEINDKVSDDTIKELVAASMEMSKNKTGALIVVEQEVGLGEYESTGINVDAAISKQLIVNIFEHNTPLHDGAVIIRNNRIVAATCYLPLTARSDLNKDLGTRHRAAVGISEVSDSITIVVSEETGAISVAQGGTLTCNLDPESLKKQFTSLQSKPALTRSRRQKNRKKGGKKNEEAADK